VLDSVNRDLIHQGAKPVQPAASQSITPNATDHRRRLASSPAPAPRIVAIGGGTGLPVLLRGLADAMGPVADAGHGARPAETLSAIVTVTDDGGSSGRLRRDLSMLPPGDIRNCLAALAGNARFERVLAHRFAAAETWLDGHAVGNLVLAALAQMTGNFAEAVEELRRLLKARGCVFPSTLEDVTLRGELESGELIDGETAIVRSPAAIHRLALARPARPYPGALRALINADVVVIGPGSLYTSVLPNLLVDGVSSTLSAVESVRVYVANLMTQPGETDGFSLDDHLRVLREHTGRDLFDYVLVNRTPPTEGQLARYRDEGAEWIPLDSCEVSESTARLVSADLLETTGSHVRHDPAKLADAILSLAERGRPS
jgi:uncharacterized cofD-like protein